MLKTKSEISLWLDKYDIVNYTINDDLTVDVAGSVYLGNRGLRTIPIQFGKVNGDFYCFSNNLTSLVGCPREVGGHFFCNNNQLKSLVGCPSIIRGGFECDDKFKNDIEYLRWVFSKKVMAL